MGVKKRFWAARAQQNLPSPLFMGLGGVKGGEGELAFQPKRRGEEPLVSS